MGERNISFQAILNHLNFGMDRLLKALKTLSALNLLTLYQKGMFIASYSMLLYLVKDFWNILFIADLLEKGD